MIKTLLNTLKQDKETFEVPRSVQDAIPIRRLWPDGMFQFGSKFSKTLRFSDINYAIASKEDKTAMFLDYSELLNALDAGSTTKITINNKRVARENVEQEILIPRRDDHLDGYRAEYNTMLLDKATNAANSVVQERYITLSVHRKSAEEARSFFDRTMHDVTAHLHRLDSHCEESMIFTAPERRMGSASTSGTVCGKGIPSRMLSVRTAWSSRKTTLSWGTSTGGCCSSKSMPATSRTP